MSDSLNASAGEVGPATALRASIGRALPRLLALSEAETAVKPAPDRWCRREILGHLIDSAANNHQRFVRGSRQGNLVFSGYDQDAWVRAQAYDVAPWADLVPLWRSYNLHLARVMDNMPADMRRRPEREHNFHEIGWKRFDPESPVTLEDLMLDYVDHLEHHLGQILG